MRFDDIIKSLLLEDNSKEIALEIKGNLIKIGDEGYLEDILGKQWVDWLMEDYKSSYEPQYFATKWEPLLQGKWELYDISDNLSKDAGRAGAGLHWSTLGPNVTNEIRDTISRSAISTHRITLNPVLETKTLHHSGAYISEILYQATLEDGKVITWYNHKQSTVFLNDTEIIPNLKEYERKTTIAAHKDHNELVDLIDL
jgi:hypothetical protein